MDLDSSQAQNDNAHVILSGAKDPDHIPINQISMRDAQTPRHRSSSVTPFATGEWRQLLQNKFLDKYLDLLDTSLRQAKAAPRPQCHTSKTQSFSELFSGRIAGLSF